MRRVGEAAVEDLFAFNILGSQAVDGTAVAPKRVVVLATPRLVFDSCAHKGVFSRLRNGPHSRTILQLCVQNFDAKT